MQRQATLRIDEDILDLIKKRAKRARRSLTNEFNLVLREALKGEILTLQEVYEALKREIYEVKAYLRSVQDTAQVAASLKPRIEKNTELMNLSVRTLDSIEAYLEKHSLQ